MPPQNSIRDTMIELREVFQSSAIELMSVMFNVEAVVIDTWDVTETSDARYDYIFRQISENKQYKANAIIGASYPALEKVLGRNIDLNEARDAFGEFANCYYAMLMENQYFFENFGILKQRVPEDSTMLACFPLAWGVQGKLHFDSAELFMRFSVEENRFGEYILALLEE
jgi:kynurenine formamidase